MDTKKRERYEAIVQQVIELAGGKSLPHLRFCIDLVPKSAIFSPV